MLYFFLKFLILINYIYFINSFKQKSFNFLKKNSIYTELNYLFTDKEDKNIILNGENFFLKKYLCKELCKINKHKFLEYSFNQFICESPHINNDDSLIYIDDFMIKNGRILNDFEEHRILNIPKSNNLIIFQSDNIQKIPFKDDRIIKRFKVLEFPNLEKKDLIHYIYDIIEKYNYDDNLYLLNWSQYNIDKLNIEHINILIFEINNMFYEGKSFNYIHNNLEIIINSMIKY
jgi:hypothetical protein